MALPILLKTEEACVALATSASIALGYVPETNIFIRAGVDNEDVKAPAILCSALTATEDFPFSGIFHCSTNITIKEMAGDMERENLGGLSEPIFRTFLSDNIEQLLTQIVSNYYVYQLKVENTTNENHEDAWSQVFTVDIVSALVA